MEYWAIKACARYYPWRTIEEAVKSTVRGEGSDVEIVAFTS